jgi:hypothetical protein
MATSHSSWSRLRKQTDLFFPGNAEHGIMPVSSKAEVNVKDPSAMGR